MIHDWPISTKSLSKTGPHSGRVWPVHPKNWSPEFRFHFFSTRQAAAAPVYGNGRMATERTNGAQDRPLNELAKITGRVVKTTKSCQNLIFLVFFWLSSSWSPSSPWPLRRDPRPSGTFLRAGRQFFVELRRAVLQGAILGEFFEGGCWAVVSKTNQFPRPLSEKNNKQMISWLVVRSYMVKFGWAQCKTKSRFNLESTEP